MDWRAGHLTTTEGMGGGGAGYLSTKIAKNFSNARGMPGGMLAAGIVSHIKFSKYGGIECISETDGGAGGPGARVSPLNISKILKS